MDKTKVWIRLMELASPFCHQMPERSFFIKGYQMPICARCTGIFISTLIAIPIFFIKTISITFSIVMCAIMLIDWLLQFLNIKKSTNKRRLITGIIGGFGYTILNLKLIKMILNKSKAN